MSFIVGIYRRAVPYLEVLPLLATAINTKAKNDHFIPLRLTFRSAAGKQTAVLRPVNISCFEKLHEIKREREREIKT
jgi:hypothetical protein